MNYCQHSLALLNTTCCLKHANWPGHILWHLAQKQSANHFCHSAEYHSAPIISFLKSRSNPLVKSVPR